MAEYDPFVSDTGAGDSTFADVTGIKQGAQTELAAQAANNMPVAARPAVAQSATPVAQPREDVEALAPGAYDPFATNPPKESIGGPAVAAALGDIARENAIRERRAWEKDEVSRRMERERKMVARMDKFHSADWIRAFGDDPNDPAVVQEYKHQTERIGREWAREKEAERDARMQEAVAAQRESAASAKAVKEAWAEHPVAGRVRDFFAGMESAVVRSVPRAIVGTVKAIFQGAAASLGEDTKELNEEGAFEPGDQIVRMADKSVESYTHVAKSKFLHGAGEMAGGTATVIAGGLPYIATSVVGGAQSRYDAMLEQGMPADKAATVAAGHLAIEAITQTIAMKMTDTAAAKELSRTVIGSLSPDQLVRIGKRALPQLVRETAVWGTQGAVQGAGTALLEKASGENKDADVLGATGEGAAGAAVIAGMFGGVKARGMVKAGREGAKQQDFFLRNVQLFGSPTYDRMSLLESARNDPFATNAKPAKPRDAVQVVGGEAPHAQVAADAARKLIDETGINLPGGIVIHATPESMAEATGSAPDDRAKDGGATGSQIGAVDMTSGTVHIDASHPELQTGGKPDMAKVRATIIEEAVGHYGLEKVLGPQKFADFATKWAGRMSKAERDAFQAQWGFAPDEIAKIGAEHLAHIALNEQQLGGVWKSMMDKLVVAFNRAMRGLGVQREYSRAEVRDVFRKAWDFARTGEGAAGAEPGADVRMKVGQTPEQRRFQEERRRQQDAYRTALRGDNGNDPLPEVSTAEQDKAWLERNPKSAEALQRMADEAAKRIGYPQPNESWRNAYEIGKRARTAGVRSQREFFESMSFAELESLPVDSPGWNAFFTAGFNGKDSPEYVTGWRYGKIPASDQSTNFRDQRMERGVSLMRLDGEDASSGAKVYEMFNRKGNMLHVGGWYAGRGTDGEPLIVGAKEIKSADPITRDDQGRVIPPSERFNPKSPDIRNKVGQTPEQRRFQEERRRQQDAENAVARQHRQSRVAELAQIIADENKSVQRDPVTGKPVGLTLEQVEMRKEYMSLMQQEMDYVLAQESVRDGYGIGQTPEQAAEQARLRQERDRKDATMAVQNATARQVLAGGPPKPAEPVAEVKTRNRQGPRQGWEERAPAMRQNLRFKAGKKPEQGEEQPDGLSTAAARDDALSSVGEVDYSKEGSARGGKRRGEYIKQTSSLMTQYPKPAHNPPLGIWVKEVKWDENALGGVGQWRVTAMVNGKPVVYGCTWAEAYNNPDFAAMRVMGLIAADKMSSGKDGKLWDFIEAIETIPLQNRLAFRLKTNTLDGMAETKQLGQPQSAKQQELLSPDQQPFNLAQDQSTLDPDAITRQMAERRRKAQQDAAQGEFRFKKARKSGDVPEKNPIAEFIRDSGGIKYTRNLKDASKRIPLRWMRAQNSKADTIDGVIRNAAAEGLVDPNITPDEFLDLALRKPKKGESDKDRYEEEQVRAEAELQGPQEVSAYDLNPGDLVKINGRWHEFGADDVSQTPVLESSTGEVMPVSPSDPFHADGVVRKGDIVYDFEKKRMDADRESLRKITDRGDLVPTDETGAAEASTLPDDAAQRRTALEGMGLSKEAIAVEMALYEGRQRVQEPVAEPAQGGERASEEPPNGGTGGGAEPTGEEPKTYGTRFEDQDKARALAFLPEREKQDPHSDQVQLDKAMATLREDPTAIDVLMAKLVTDKRIPVESERWLMIVESARRERELNDAIYAERQLKPGAPGMYDALLRTERARTRFMELTEAWNPTKSEVGRALREMQIRLDEDLNYANVPQDLERRLGRKPEPEEIAARNKLVDAVVAARKARGEVEAQMDAMRNKRDAQARLGDLVGEGVGQQREYIAPEILDRARKIVSKIKATADKKWADAADEWAQFTRGGTNEAIGGTVKLSAKLLDAAAWKGAEILAETSLDIAAFTDRMAAMAGNHIRPFAGQIYEEAKKVLRGETKGDKRVEGALGKVKEDAELPTIEELQDRAKKAAEKNTPVDKLGPLIDQLARVHIREDGITKIDPMVDALRNDLSDAYPSITGAQIHEAWSRYGKFSTPDQEASEVAFRDMKAQALKLAQLHGLATEYSVKRTGPQRDKMSDEVRRLQQELHQKMKEAGVSIGHSPEEELQSIQATIARRLAHQLADMMHYLETGEKVEKTPGVQYSEANEATRSIKDRVKAVIDDITPTDPRQVTAAKIERAITQYERLAAEAYRMMADKVYERPRAEPLPETPALTAARSLKNEAYARLKALAEASKPQTSDEAKQAMSDLLEAERALSEANAKGAPRGMTPRTEETAPILDELYRAWQSLAEKRVAKERAAKDARAAQAIEASMKADRATIERLERQIADDAGKPPARSMEADRVRLDKKAAAEKQAAEEEAALTPAQRELKQRIADLKEVRKAVKMLADATMSPEEKLLMREIQRVNDRIEKSRAAMDANDLTARKRKNKARYDTSEYDHRIQELQRTLDKRTAQLNQSRAAIADARAMDMLSQRPGWVKTMDFLGALVRFNVLSGITILPKLGAYSAQAFILKPVTTLARLAMRPLGLWKQTGQYDSINALARFYASFPQGFRDAAQEIRTGSTDLKDAMRDSQAYGTGASRAEESMKAPRWLSFPQRTHAAMKAVLLRAEREWSQQASKDYIMEMQRRDPAMLENKVKLYDEAIRRGMDPDDPFVQSVIDAQSYLAGKDAILMGKSGPMTQMVKGAVQRVEGMKTQEGKPSFPGRAGGLLLRSMAPVVSVPENFIIWSLRSGPVGLLSGAGELAVRGSVRKLTQEQAMRIEKNLVYGTIGTAAFLLQAYTRANGNPILQRGNRDDQKGDRHGWFDEDGTYHPLLPGEVAIGKTRMSKYWMHIPIVEAMFLADGICDAIERYHANTPEDEWTTGKWLGHGAAYGTVEHVGDLMANSPLSSISVNPLNWAKSLGEESTGAGLGKTVMSRAVPLGITQIGQRMDPDSPDAGAWWWANPNNDVRVQKRKVDDFFDAFKAAIPVARKSLDEDTGKRARGPRKVKVGVITDERD